MNWMNFDAQKFLSTPIEAFDFQFMVGDVSRRSHARFVGSCLASAPKTPARSAGSAPVSARRRQR
jgi:hypothetical protein